MPHKEIVREGSNLLDSGLDLNEKNPTFDHWIECPTASFVSNGFNILFRAKLFGKVDSLLKNAGVFWHLS